MRAGLSWYAAFFCWIGVCWMGLGHAQDSKAPVRKDMSIPAERLGIALQTLARNYNFQVLYPTLLVANLKTHGAQGSMTEDEALVKVLSGTGLSYKYLDPNTVTVFATPASRSP